MTSSKCPAMAGVVERVLGMFVLEQCALIAGPHHRVPEPPHVGDRLYLVVGAVVNQHRRISRPHELDQRVFAHPSRKQLLLHVQNL